MINPILTRGLLLSILLLLCESGAGRGRAVESFVGGAGRILIVTAHPDDEILIAPLLASRCVRGGAVCTLLVMTAGEGGGPPDVRTGELARSAALLNARLSLWSFADVMVDVDAVWSAQAGGRATLLRQVSDVIAAEQPDMILTFDPAHGSTCHPAHRAIGQLVLDTGARNVFLIETAARFVGESFVLSNAAPESWVQAANEDWQYVVRVAETHASQFSAAQVESLRTLPAEQRRVWFLPAGKASSSHCE